MTGYKKIIITALLLAALCLCVCGCSAQTAPAAETAAEAPAETAAPTPSPKPADVELLGKKLPYDTESVDLSGLKKSQVDKAAEALSKLDYLRNVTLGTQEESELDWDDIKKLHEACPDALLDYDFTLYGKPFNLSDEELDIKYITIYDEGKLVKTISACMRDLKVLDMDSCGLPDETMAEIRDSLPNTEVIWRITFGDYYSVRTNVERILASLPGQGGELVRENVGALKYCTKVKYIDLGHNNFLNTIDFVSYMPDLEVAIFGMSFIDDFSPLANCPKLEYLEAMSSRLHDLTPFAELKNLKHLNICYNFSIRDITPLYGLTKLERLWIGKYAPVPPEQFAEIKRLLPNCIVNDTVEDPTDDGWRMALTPSEGGDPRYEPRYELLRQQFGYTENDYALAWKDPYYRVPWEIDNVSGELS